MQQCDGKGQVVVVQSASTGAIFRVTFWLPVKKVLVNPLD
jgi:hypothetical protein